MPPPASAVLRRRHTQELTGGLVEAAAGIEPRVEDRFGHRRATVLEFAAHARRPMSRGVGLGCDARHGLEHAMEVVRAHARSRRQVGQRRRLLGGLDAVALSATFAVCRCSSDGSFGRHRRHGRKPARSASATVVWKRTFLGFGRREGQDGRQYTPVVFTE